MPSLYNYKIQLADPNSDLKAEIGDTENHALICECMIDVSLTQPNLFKHKGMRCGIIPLDGTFRNMPSEMKPHVQQKHIYF